MYRTSRCVFLNKNRVNVNYRSDDNFSLIKCVAILHHHQFATKMFTVLILFTLSALCSAFNTTFTPFSQWDPPRRFEGYVTTGAEKYDYVPQDNGGNYGDLIHLSRQTNDVLLAREVEINPPFNQDTILELTANFGRSITSVYVLNFGNERGYTEEISTEGNSVYVRIAIRARYEIRMLIDVYGFR